MPPLLYVPKPKCTERQAKVLPHFECFARNARWGTCGYCPRDTNGKAYPEFCQDTDRYDHNLPLQDLVDLFNRLAK